MFVAILALVIATTKKDKFSLKTSKNQSVKPLSPDPNPVDTGGCYAAFQALADAYLEELGNRRLSSRGSKKNLLKGNKMKPNSPPDIPGLIEAFESACPATAGDNDCKTLLDKLKDDDPVPLPEDKEGFSTTCKVDAPAGGGGGGDDAGDDAGDDSGDNGIISSKANKFMMLFGLASTLLYFLH
jgi:hypothetical protein